MQGNHTSPKHVDAIVDMAALALAFGRINRLTFHPDGVRPETNTDHTVMLGLLAPALADVLYHDTMDKGRIAELALVHDVPEVYAGDTHTLRHLSDDARSRKKLREARAVERLDESFGTKMPWLLVRIAEYESLATPEARFVKALDKILPKLTEILNDGATCKAAGATRKEMAERWPLQRKEMMEYAADFPELMDLYDVFITMHLETLT